MEEIFNVKLDIGTTLSGQSMGYNRANNFQNSWWFNLGLTKQSKIYSEDGSFNLGFEKLQ